jgi:signal transduction histidine kinase
MTPERVWFTDITIEGQRSLRTALEALGWPIQEVASGASIASLAPSGGLELLVREVPQSGARAATTPFPTLWILPPGATLPPFTGMGPHEFLRLPAPQEEIVTRALALVRAAHRERTLERYEREATEQLERRRGMVRTIAHDLMSPLTAVMEYIELLIDGTVGTPSETQAQLLREAQGASRRVHERVEEIVDANRAELGMPIPVQLRRTEVPPLLAGVQEWAIPILRSKTLDLVLHLEPETPPVCGDPDRIEQVLRLLVDQAQRSAPAGSRIEVGVARDPDATGFVRLTVAVSHRVAADTAEFRPGTPLRPPALPQDDWRGLTGMTLVRAIAQAMGGEIQSTSVSEGVEGVVVRVPSWGSRVARIAQAQSRLAAAETLPGHGWVCRVLGSPPAANGDGDLQTLRQLDSGEMLAIAPKPPAGVHCVGRVRDLREPGSLFRALQPRLRIQMIREKAVSTQSA